jgi:hypothetical protein
MPSARHCCGVVARLGVCGQIFLKVSNIKFHENPRFDSCADTCRRTDVRKNEELCLRQTTFSLAMLTPPDRNCLWTKEWYKEDHNTDPTILWYTKRSMSEMTTNIL